MNIGPTPHKVASCDPAVVLSSNGRKLGRAHQASGADPHDLAKLWAASPAMYEALQAIASHDNWGLNGGEGSRQCMDWMVATAKAALASADGEAR